MVLMGLKREILGLYNNGIVEKKMETTVQGLGFRGLRA